MEVTQEEIKNARSRLEKKSNGIKVLGTLEERAIFNNKGEFDNGLTYVEAFVNAREEYGKDKMSLDYARINVELIKTNGIIAYYLVYQ